MTDKKIKLSGAYNFRDFGGYRNKEGKRLIRGRLYRSDELSKITAADQEKLVQLGISKIIDYRNKKERLNNEDRPIGNAEILYLTPIADIAALASSEHDEESALSPQKMTAALAKELMIRQNEEFVENKQCQDVYREVLEIHLAEEGAIVQHCRGGKDRTGYGVALIQLLLGVSEANVMHDYLLTNVYKKEKNEKSLQLLLQETDNPDFVQAMRYFKEADRHFLQNALARIGAYGGVEGYVVNKLGFSQQKIRLLREKYLQN